MEKNITMNRIRELREDRDMRQVDLSAATGIDQKTVSNYETGKTNPDSWAIIKLAEFFGVSCDYLLGVSSRNVRSADDVLSEIEAIKLHLNEIEKYLKNN